MSEYTEEEIKCWLQVALKREDISDFSVSYEGNTEKGDGCMGNIFFVKVTATTSTKSRKNYHLALKCSKKSKELRQAVPVKECFENEIYLYEHIVSLFNEFQKKKGVTNIFNSLPKYYGSYTCEDMEIVVLEDLKSAGYYLSDRKKPLPTNHLKLILCEYAKFHAISAAIQDQEPDNFRKIIQGIAKVWKLFADRTDIETYFRPSIEETYNLVKSDLSESVAEKLKNFKTQVKPIINEVIEHKTRFSVITHGDCWNNNFMFKSKEKNGETSLSVAMLDWQTTKYSNPVLDVSYFIYACASEEDLQHFDELLKLYHDTFSNYVTLLGSDPDKLFPFSQFLEDLKLFGKYGVMITMLAVKVALSDKEEAPDFVESAEGGIENTFSFKNRDQNLLKSRMSYILQHVATQDIL